MFAPRPPGRATASVVVIACVPAGLVSSGEVSLHQTSGVLCRSLAVAAKQLPQRIDVAQICWILVAKLAMDQKQRTT